MNGRTTASSGGRREASSLPRAVAGLVAVLASGWWGPDYGRAVAAEKPPPPDAASQKKLAHPLPQRTAPAAAPGAGPGRSLAEDYCRSAIEPAREARHAAQVRQLEQLRKELDERLSGIEARIVELKTWHAKRETFSDRATAQLIGIFGAMRPESASEQLTQMGEETAAAIISKLEARSASAILNDMPAEKAARLAGILAAAARKSEAGEQK